MSDRMSSISGTFQSEGDTLRLTSQHSQQLRMSSASLLRPMTSIALDDMFNRCYIRNESLKRLSVIGHGAFAIVEKAELTLDDGSRRIVAVKQLLPDILKEPTELNNFIQEASSLSKLHQSNIIEFIGIGCTDRSSRDRMAETLYIVQDYLQGGTLRRAVMEQMTMTPKPLYSLCDALRWMLGVAEGLAYLHSCRPMVIHRDLKLENILLKGKDMSTATTVICDFGLMRYIERTDNVMKRIGEDPSYHAGAARDGNPSIVTSYIGDSLHPQRLPAARPADPRLAFAEAGQKLETPASMRFLDLTKPRDQSSNGSSSIQSFEGGPPAARHISGSKDPTVSDGSAYRGTAVNEDRSVLGRIRRMTSGTSSASLSPRLGGNQRIADRIVIIEGVAPEPQQGAGSKDPSLSASSALNEDRSMVNRLRRLFDMAGGSTLGGTAAAASAAQRVKNNRINKSTMHDLTGQTGSLMYMAPEVFLQQPYNQMVDVFSFGMVMYEVFHRDVMETHLAIGEDEAEGFQELTAFADRVSRGYRPDILVKLPTQLVTLITDCWAQSPTSRPSMHSVVERLKMIERSGELDLLDEQSAMKSGCCW